jgi:hypothetical protein
MRSRCDDDVGAPTSSSSAPARSCERLFASFAARDASCDSRLSLASSDLVIPELVQHRVLLRGVLLGACLEVHAADERLGLGDVRLGLADPLNLGI